MKVFENNYNGINMMLWETHIQKRKPEGNEIQFVLTSKREISVGDIIVGLYNSESGASCWEISEIIEQRDAALKGMINYRCIAKWYKKSMSFFDGKTELCSMSFEQSIIKYKENLQADKSKS